jgi:hypothetical protein
VDRAYRVAHLLRDELGLQPGDHAAILMGNRVEYPEILLNRFRNIALTNTLPRHPNGKGTLSGSQST